MRRDRLRGLLDAAVDAAAVTLVRSGAGQGRTLALADWARTGPTGWVSADPTIDRPDRFWTAVAAAVARAVPWLVDDVRRTGRPVDRSTTAGDVLGVLDGLPHEVRLVLDDVHELTRPAVVAELRTLIRYRPVRLRLVLSSRAEPPLSLARLRLQGDLAEVPGHALGFTVEETTELVARSGLAVRGDEIERLHGLTAGWAAALRLAVDAAGHGSPGLARVLAVLAGEDLPPAQELARAVLARLPGPDRSLLRAVSVADQVPPALAVELSGLDDAGGVLARLHDLGVVVEDAASGHHTLQPLLRRRLRQELERDDPARAAALHGRAARWFAGAERPDLALEHAGLSGEPGLVAELLREWAVPLVLAGHHEDLRAGLRSLRPPAVVRDRRLRAAAGLLERSGSDTGAAGDPDAELAALRALRVGVRAARPQDSDAPDAPGAERARRAREAADEALDAACAGVGALADDPSAARLRLEQALSTAQDRGWPSLAMRCAAVLAATDLEAGDTAAMTRHGAAAVAAADDGACGAAASALSARATLAYASLLRAHPGDARRHAADGLAAAGATDAPAVRLLLHALHGAAEADDGRPVDGLEEMQRARTAFSDRSLAGPQAAVVATLEHEVALVLGRSEHAGTVCRWLTARVGTTGDVLLMAARSVPDPAPLLRASLDGSAPALLAASEIEARLRQIAVGPVVADPARARKALVSALDRAAPLGLVRPFANSVGTVRTLMAHQVGTFGPWDAFVRRALAARPPGRRHRPVEPLSVREEAVLRLLPSLATMSEIAQDLEVSVNTVKTQVGAIYAKLGVGDRRDAVVAAYDTGLLRVPGPPEPDDPRPWSGAG